MPKWECPNCRAEGLDSVPLYCPRCGTPIGEPKTETKVTLKFVKMYVQEMEKFKDLLERLSSKEVP